nr:cupin domain-containing protein [Acanthopleuribacter pedis]
MLQPFDAQTFIGEHWDQKLLHLQQRAGDFYQELFSLAAVDEVLQTGGWTPDELIVVKQGKHDGGDYLKADGLPNMAKLFEAFYQQGKTLQLYGVEKRHPGVAALCRQLERCFHQHAHATIFFTPPGCNGLNTHFDTKDAFILQISGRKHWLVYEHAMAWPSRVSDRFKVAPENYGELLVDATLQPGDLMYVPRGMLHAPSTHDELSLHLTIGFDSVTWFDVFQEALERARATMPEMRQAIRPDQFENPQSDLLQEQATRLANQMLTGAAPSDIIQQFRRNLHERTPAPADGHFRWLERLQHLDGHDRLRHREGVHPWVTVDDQQSDIIFAGGSVRGPASLADAMNFIATTPEFQVSAIGGGLSENAKVLLARRLIISGLLTFSEPGTVHT